MVSIVKLENPARRLHTDKAQGVVVVPIAEVPAGVSVQLLKIEPGGHKRFCDLLDREALCVVAGAGVVETSGDRQPISDRNIVFIYPGDEATITTESGLTLISVFGGWDI